MNAVTAIIMLGPAGSSVVEELVHGAQQLATQHLINALSILPNVERVIIAAPQEEINSLAVEETTRVIFDPDSSVSDFHFGKRLVGIVIKYGLERILYFGGASAPLLPESELERIADDIAVADERYAITNNLFSSDWIALTSATVLSQYTERLPRDNMLGWVLQEEAEYSVQALAPRAATRLDIDTPSDLLALRWHPATDTLLQEYLAKNIPTSAMEAWLATGLALSTPATQIVLIGRVASGVWQYVDQNTRCWIRVFSEERGMSSSGRKEAGTVRSLIADYMESSGVENFFQSLAEFVDALLIDTRVYLAHHQIWPSAADRFAADLGLVDQIQDERLKHLTQAIRDCGMPVVMGGHGVVSGGLYALIETIKAGALP